MGPEQDQNPRGQIPLDFKAQDNSFFDALPSRPLGKKFSLPETWGWGSRPQGSGRPRPRVSGRQGWPYFWERKGRTNGGVGKSFQVNKASSNRAARERNGFERNGSSCSQEGLQVELWGRVTYLKGCPKASTVFWASELGDLWVKTDWGRLPYKNNIYVHTYTHILQIYLYICSLSIFHVYISI